MKRSRHTSLMRPRANRIRISYFACLHLTASRSTKLRVSTHCTLKKWIENLEQMVQQSAQFPDSPHHRSQSTKQLILHSILKEKHPWIKRLHRLLDQFRLVSGRLEEHRFLNAENGYQVGRFKSERHGY